MSKNPQLEEPIFFVDDEPDLGEVVGSLLERDGYRARIFSKPEELIEALGSTTPFLILSDYRMPGMTGLDLCREIRRIRTQVPFVLLTGFADKEMAVKGLENGVNGLLEKPIEAKNLLRVVHEHATARVAALAEERRELDEIRMIFTEESAELMTDTEQLVLRLEEEPIDTAVIDLLFRKIHSIKGGAGSIPGAELLASLQHDFESVLSEIKKRTFVPDAPSVNLFLLCCELTTALIARLRQLQDPDQELRDRTEKAIAALRDLKNGNRPAAKAETPKVTEAQVRAPADDHSTEDEGVWVTNEKLDSFMALSGELIVLKNNFQMIGRDGEDLVNQQRLEKKLAEFSYSLNKITDHLQDQIMSVRKITLERALNKIPRIVRQTCQETGKKVRLKMTGLELGVDKNIAKALGTSLIHMVRNSIDHGVESPDARVAAGKSAEGSLELSATEVQGTIQLILRDDGAGINAEKVVKKAVANGLLDDSRAAAMSEAEKLNLIFLPGLSTADKISNVSGRGVGMDVVRSSVLALNGRIRIDSRPQHGTAFHIDVPVPKAVMVEQTLLGRWGDAIFAVPLKSISRITTCDTMVMTEVQGTRTCQFDGQTIPLRTYREFLNNKDFDAAEDVLRKSVVIISEKGRAIGLLLDRIEDQLEAVIRPFDGIVEELPGFKGTCVLGSESIAYIVSPETMLDLAYQTSARSA